MEQQEDFGFTRRHDNVLKKLLTVDNERTPDKGTIYNDEQQLRFSSKVQSFSYNIACIILSFFFSFIPCVIMSNSK